MGFPVIRTSANDWVGHNPTGDLLVARSSQPELYFSSQIFRTPITDFRSFECHDHRSLTAPRSVPRPQGRISASSLTT
jgi:hypothetical protein